MGTEISTEREKEGEVGGGMEEVGMEEVDEMPSVLETTGKKNSSGGRNTLNPRLGEDDKVRDLNLTLVE